MSARLSVIRPMMSSFPLRLKAGRNSNRLCLYGQDWGGEGGREAGLWRGRAAERGRRSAGRRGPRLADYTGGLIVVRERKGSRPWCSPAPVWPPGEGSVPNKLCHAPGVSWGVCHVAHLPCGSANRKTRGEGEAVGAPAGFILG